MMKVKVMPAYHEIVFSHDEGHAGRSQDHASPQNLAG